MINSVAQFPGNVATEWTYIQAILWKHFEDLLLYNLEKVQACILKLFFFKSLAKVQCVLCRRQPGLGSSQEQCFLCQQQPSLGSQQRQYALCQEQQCLGSQQEQCVASQHNADGTSVKGRCPGSRFASRKIATGSPEGYLKRNFNI